MNTPICDFVRRYAQTDPLRLHMPGHKGAAILGMEALDITEIPGADSLYAADGIIRESEQNAGSLFGAFTFYSTEGSSLCIRAMVSLLCMLATETGKKPLILACRNAHKTFMTACGLTDCRVQWLYGHRDDHYLSCVVTPDTLEQVLSQAAEKPVAVYVTSPDYLGNMADIAGLSAVCHRYGVVLAVDNAHGAYLHFLEQSQHPLALGADLCCDSAHKTLPVLTGGAYLHIRPDAPALLRQQAKRALSLFGSTSPSYLILQSLDMANTYLADTFRQQLRQTVAAVAALKARLSEKGFTLMGQEPLKLTLDASAWGYTGTQLAEILRQQNIYCEFADPEYLVLMFTPQLPASAYSLVEDALLAIGRRSASLSRLPACRCPQVLSIREAMLRPSQVIPVGESVGRILADPCVGCPPAVPILVCGERITPEAVCLFAHYGVSHCAVVVE